MPARVRAQISCEQTQSCDGNGEMNASSAFVSLNEKKRKKKRMVRNKKNQIYGDFFYDRNKCVCVKT